VIKFRILESIDMNQIRLWRNEQLSILRTSYGLTQQSQLEFYNNKISNRDSNCRFWAVISGDKSLCGMVGLENIQWDNRIAEISLITDPDKANLIPNILKTLLEIAFDHINLVSVFSEVYECSPYLKLWEQTSRMNNGMGVSIPLRKFHGGKYHDSTLFTFIRGVEVTNESTSLEPTSELN